MSLLAAVTGDPTLIQAKSIEADRTMGYSTHHPLALQYAYFKDIRDKAKADFAKLPPEQQKALRDAAMKKYGTVNKDGDFFPNAEYFKAGRMGYNLSDLAMMGMYPQQDWQKYVQPGSGFVSMLQQP